MMEFENVIDKEWRKKELSLKEVIAKYSEVSPYIVIKTDVQRRGVRYSEKALELVDPKIHQVSVKTMFSNKESNEPVSLLLNDGTSIISSFTSSLLSKRDPYLVDVVDGKIVLTDAGEVVTEVSYWEKPDFYEKYTSSGVPMSEIASARPQRIDINPNGHCEFWDKPGNGCKYCTIGTTYHKNKDKPARLRVEDIVETVREALKQPGRFTAFNMSAGTILSGSELLEDELEMYITILQEVGKLFHGKVFPSQITATAFSPKQLKRLREETRLWLFTTDIEVFDEDLFGWICPGKAEFVGYKEWKQRIFEAAEIFGKGHVNAGIVSGVEMAKPKGFIHEDEAVARALEGAEEFAEHGVFMKHDIWHVAPGTIFFKQTPPSLEYYIKLTEGFDKIARRYELLTYADGYRWCGNHPNTDLSRI
ncbi:MAG: radical SAM protein [Lachnospiraceae bacterium]|nr:radical SAM protein [Lachnospiraceae bacterium]